MSSPLLIEMSQRLDAGLARRSENRSYWAGKQPLAYLAPEARQALGNRFGVLAVNFPRVAVTALTERLRLNGFDGTEVWDDLLRCDYDQLAHTLHREALLQGEAYVLVWADESGNPTVTIESGETVAVKRNPVNPAVVTAAIKRVRVKTTPSQTGHTDIWIYTPEWVQHWRSNAPGGSGEFVLQKETPNPLGVVPVVPFTNSDLLPSAWSDALYLEYSGESEIEPLKNLVDGLNKTVADLAVAQEFTARPRRWATGIEATEAPVVAENGDPVLDGAGEPVTEAVNPIPEGNRAMLSANDAARFGQLDGANLAGFRTAVDIWVQQIMTVTALPAHMCGITTANPSTADAIRAAEAGLTSRAEAKGAMFGRSHEQVACLVYAIRHKVSPSAVVARALWGPFDQRSEAASADAAVKLYASGLLSRTATLRRLGFTANEIAEELGHIERDAQLGQDIALGRYVRNVARPTNSSDSGQNSSQ
ncbi:Phage portal protein, SPP1 Gp6 [Mycobacteroides abscessus subsp. abscessus]|uniref:phage portal protein n=1 Tax=Mycobacteroides abscessus TaxID=36809 RepID=UPI0009263899|nr:phage portal protein [Mycobacteroides abscessus]SHX04470.1 Phage portal protein, SPP1 Gp6 [Mycobacteroides abscessus subsp. abscessus]SID11812.1 Phage portal protein, SPP1 Gp6 [Mycobacteroides abscessus subsp. abscessus]SIE18568.1 Phage portal protein, SPP1 Gp6 [Mycobacteroides abscessus subsp. abscessus]SIH46843.1 Phage portal protein, SPP1 Gp6 [Mycobacteroides abscessus subsp. abscessus]SKK58000.1 Phage portal protein, SPP1 Gp6 [Mycobacteroides abscessus subsp. abscessus]